MAGRRPLCVLRAEREMQDISVGESEKLGELQVEADGSSSLLYSVLVLEGIYEGQRHEFLIKIPSEYPFKPPKAHCLSPIFHPSVDALGRVCLNITREDWSIYCTLQHVIFGILSLFYDVTGEDPLNAAAGELLKTSEEAFKRRAAEVYKGGRE